MTEGSSLVQGNPRVFALWRGAVRGAHSSLADHVSLPGNLGCEIPHGTHSEEFRFPV